MATLQDNPHQSPAAAQPVPSLGKADRDQRPGTAGRHSLRRAPSVREFKSFLQSVPGKLFKRGNQSEVCLPTTINGVNNIKGIASPTISAVSPKVVTAVLNTEAQIIEPIPVVPLLPASTQIDPSVVENSDMKRPFSSGIFASHDPSPPSVPPIDPCSSSVNKSDWAPDLSPIEFSPTLSVSIPPLSPPTSPPPSRSRPFSFRRKFSIRSISSTTSQPSPTTNYAPNGRVTHERRRSKYLNDPTVLSLLDRKFEEALEMGFTSPPQTPIRVPSPGHSSLQKSPFRLSFDNTILEDPTEDNLTGGDRDIFTTSPNLTLPTLRELEGETTGGEGEGMTLRLTLTPATALVEGEEEVMLESATGLGKRMSSLGRILSRSRSRSRKVKI